MTKKKIFIATFIIANLTIAYFFYNFLMKEQGIDEPQEIEEIEVIETSAEVQEQPQEQVYTERNLDEKLPLDISEDIMQNYIHQMSHAWVGKVDGNKRGHFPPTQQRIERLLEVVQANVYNQGILYKEILTRWQKGDFTNSVDDHNNIWELQNGDIGYANRLYSPEEHEEYMMEYFQ